MLTSGILSGVLSRSIFELCVATIGALTTCLLAWYYLRRVRMDRPAIGKFNRRDVLILFVFLAILPAIYLVLPQWGITSLLALTFMASLSIGFSQLIGPTKVWLGIGILLGANIWIGLNLLGTVPGWQLFWAETSLITLLGAISVANLYVQGGMQLRHVAFFALGLAIYDVIFTIVWPISNYLVREFVGHPLFPAIGMRIGFDEAIIGLGDLLVYALFTTAAVKAYGRSAARIALTLVFVFGAALPATSSLLINYIDARSDIVIPAQTWFGPAAFLGYLWMRRRWGRERTMREFLASSDVVRPTEAVPPPTPEPALEAPPALARSTTPR
jgi:hypothetical protein